MSADELDHTPLVDGRRVLSHGCRDIPADLEQTASELGVSAVFEQRFGDGNHRRARVDMHACADDRTIQRGAAMGATADLDADLVDRMVWSSLSPRRPTVVSLVRLHCSDAGAFPYFSLPAKS